MSYLLNLITNSKLNTMEYNILNDLLLFWEDTNRIMELYYHINKHYGDNDRRPLDGSEVNKYFFQVRAIQKYQGLRTMLEKSDPRAIMDNGFETFLPSIPTGMQNEFKDSRVLFVMQKMHSIYMTPFFLSSWALNKKICSIQNRSLLEEITPTENNYLDKLPYSSFLLDIGDGLTFDFKLDKNHSAKVCYRYFILERVGDTIDVFGIPDDIKDYCESENDRKVIIDAINALKDIPLAAEQRLQSKGNKAFGKAVHRIKVRLKGIATILSNRKKESTMGDYAIPLFFTFQNIIDITSGTFSFKGISALTVRETQDIAPALLGRVLSTINGFCKLLFEHQTPEIEIVLNENDKEEIEKNESCETTALKLQTEKLKWYEVPVNNIDFMKLHKSKGKLVVSITRGGEKSPHQRRGHVRIYRNADGSERRRIYLKSLIVRKDKLLKGSPSKSGVLKV